MTLHRRELLGLAGPLVAAAWLPHASAAATAAARVKAVVFDAFPIFDPRSVAALAEQLYPGRGTELMNLWRTRQFEYQWLRALAEHYADFEQTTDEALVFAANTLGLELGADTRARLVAAHSALGAWPDAAVALRRLKDMGLGLAFLSNMTRKMLEANIAHAGLDGLFDHILSTDAGKAFKPQPRAYRIALDALRLEREEIVFVAFAGWDAAGAKWFGYPTFWLNRLGAQEEFGVASDGSGRDLAALVKFVEARSGR
jgi:2-haloacid dehalogenase